MKTQVTFRTNGNFAIHVTDLTKAEHFYGEVLGFKLLSKTKEHLVFDTGAIRLYVNKDEKIIPFIPALNVEDYNIAKEYLKQQGCEIVTEHAGGKSLYFKDPFGIVMDIIED